MKYVSRLFCCVMPSPVFFRRHLLTFFSSPKGHPYGGCLRGCSACCCYSPALGRFILAVLSDFTCCSLAPSDLKTAPEACFIFWCENSRPFGGAGGWFPVAPLLPVPSVARPWPQLLPSSFLPSCYPSSPSSSSFRLGVELWFSWRPPPCPLFP